MGRLLFPLIIIAIAIGLFFGVTDGLINDPLVQTDSVKPKVEGGILALQKEKATLDEALTNARKLAARMDKLTTAYNALPQEKLDRLDLFLPDAVDNVQLVIDINNIAKDHGMSIRDVKIATEEPKTQTSVISRPGSMEQGSVGLAFTVTGPYLVFQDFLIDLSRSIRIVDIDSVDLTTSATKGLYDYHVELKTHWLK